MKLRHLICRNCFACRFQQKFTKGGTQRRHLNGGRYLGPNKTSTSSSPIQLFDEISTFHESLLSILALPFFFCENSHRSNLHKISRFFWKFIDFTLKVAVKIKIIFFSLYFSFQQRMMKKKNRNKTFAIFSTVRELCSPDKIII